MTLVKDGRVVTGMLNRAGTEKTCNLGSILVVNGREYVKVNRRRIRDGITEANNKAWR